MQSQLGLAASAPRRMSANLKRTSWRPSSVCRTSAPSGTAWCPSCADRMCSQGLLALFVRHIMTVFASHTCSMFLVRPILIVSKFTASLTLQQDCLLTPSWSPGVSRIFETCLVAPAESQETKKSAWKNTCLRILNHVSLKHLLQMSALHAKLCCTATTHVRYILHRAAMI